MVFLGIFGDIVTKRNLNGKLNRVECTIYLNWYTGSFEWRGQPKCGPWVEGVYKVGHETPPASSRRKREF